MKISELIKALDDFINEHGDCEIETEYWCNECRDMHEGSGLQLDLRDDNKVEISVVHIGMGD